MTFRVAFMGTPDFAVPALRALADAGHTIAAVYTQPSRPAGRGHKETPPAVHVAASEMGIAVRSPATLKALDVQAAFAGLDLDAAVVAAYGQILPAAMLAAPRMGCINLHGSLLPRWRGAAPIARAIMAGDTTFGVTIMAMDAGLDTGPMLIQELVPVGDRPTAGDVHDAFAVRGAALMVTALEGLADGSVTPVPQPEAGVTMAPKLTKAEGQLDWSRPAAALDRLVRGLSPAPGAWFEHNGARIKVLEAELVFNVSGAPGQVLDNALTVVCGQDALRLTRLQRAGRATMAAAEFLRGIRIAAGSRLIP